MKNYDHRDIEQKWQKVWAEQKTFEAQDNSSKPKFYGLIEFPYPSGAGLHVGHVRSNTAMDIITRKRRMEGFNVLYPIGWDAFGLPTENYAIKTGIQPAEVTRTNTDNFRRQLQAVGFSFDWSREVNTTDPKYYKWTQWIFLQMFKSGLAYKKKMVINWCPKDKIGLANEEVIDGCCERCGTQVERREKEQWMLAITKYADRLDADLDTVDYLPKIKTQQRNWIGKSEGAEIEFKIANTTEKIKVFTTRPDTLFGVTYLVLAPENKLVGELESRITNINEVKQYQAEVKAKTEIDRTDAKKEKTGVELQGVKAINPANGEEIPVWIADYVLADYGTGAVMAVPAHDERDWEFAGRYGLEIKRVLNPDIDSGDFWNNLHGGMSRAVNGLKDLKEMDIKQKKEAFARIENKNMIWTGSGILTNSGQFDGLQSEEAKRKITEFVGGNMVTTYKLRDWIFSRQRYWGEPIPLIHCEKCASERGNGWVAVPDAQLPVELPKVDKYEPTDNGESPLATISEWVNTTCPTCGSPAQRETDTMPNWGGSSWYYLRYTDVHNDTAFASAENLKYWTPVDWYNGGMEHTTLHLLYSRFWHKFLFDQGLVPTSEPYAKRTSQGLILATDGAKISKSKGNGIDPMDIVDTWGADSLRLYQMFMGPFDQPVAWNSDAIIGVRRFLEKVWRLQEKVQAVGDDAIQGTLHKTIKKVTEDIEAMRFNTAISAMMVLVNEMEKVGAIAKSDFELFLKLLSPFAPHMAEEIWAILGHTETIAYERWPVADMSKIVETTVTVVVQVQGKVRGQVTMPVDSTQESVLASAQAEESVAKWLTNMDIKKVIYVKNKLINIVI